MILHRAFIREDRQDASRRLLEPSTPALGQKMPSTPAANCDCSTSEGSRLDHHFGKSAKYQERKSLSNLRKMQSDIPACSLNQPDALFFVAQSV